MAGVEAGSWSGITLFWDIASDGMMVIALQGPSFHLRNFASPSDLMESFLVAIRNAGVDLSQTETIRTRVLADATFTLSWSGRVDSDRETVSGVMRTISYDLGIHEL